MKDKLIEILFEIDEVDFMELHHSLALARRIRIMLRENNKDGDWFCEKLQISKREFKGMINGCYPFDLRIISKLDAVELSLEMEKTKSEHGEWLTFPDYKYSHKTETPTP